MSKPYEIRYAAEAVEDIRDLRKSDQQKALDGIARYLTHEPTFESKNRIKVMKQPFWSQFRLRIDELRVYYDVDDASSEVNVLRVLEKTTEVTPKESP